MKKWFKSKFKMAEYWHLEMYVIIPFAVLWTILLIIIASKITCQ